jgi:hypothetical protein
MLQNLMNKKMKFAKDVKGFDPNHIFHDHMVSF